MRRTTNFSFKVCTLIGHRIHRNSPLISELKTLWEEVEAERTVSPGRNGSRYSVKIVRWERDGDNETQWAHWSMKGRKDD